MKRIKSRFLLGLCVGLVLGAAGSASALAMAPELIGGTGYLFKWDVTDSDGDIICNAPFVWAATHEIQCD